MRIYLLAYYKEIDYEDFSVEKYNLIGVYFSEDDAQEAKDNIVLNMKIDEEYLFVSGTKVGYLQWEGGFVTV